MDPLPIGSGSGVRTKEVANINDPSAELATMTSTKIGDLVIAYLDSGAADKYTIYAWDDSVAVTQTPYTCPDSGTGAWVAVAGAYVAGNIRSAGSLIGASGAFDSSLSVVSGLTLSGTDDASSTTTGILTNAGGQGVAKRSFLGSIASTFKGNVLAGVQDGTAVVAGQVGEALSSVVSAVTVTGSGTAGNVTSLAVTAGAWHIYAFGVVNGGATGLTSGSTAKLSIVTGSATNGTSGATMAQQSVLALLANDLFSLSVLPIPVVITGSITYYLTEEVTFAAGSPTVSGTLAAVRIR